MIIEILGCLATTCGVAIVAGAMASYGRGTDLPEVRSFEDAEQKDHFTTYPM